MSLWTELWTRVGEIGRDVGLVSKKVNTLSLGVVTDGLSVFRTDRDANGIFVTTTWKRLDGTTAKTAVFSLPDGSSRYTNRTDTIYDLNGTTILVQRTFVLSYNGFDEVIQEELAVTG